MRWPTVTWQGKLVGGRCFRLQHMASVPGEYESPANSCVLWRAMTMTAVPRESRTEAPLTSSAGSPHRARSSQQMALPPRLPLQHLS